MQSIIISDIENDTWKVIGQGYNDGEKTVLHLASLTRGKQQRNGWFPNQIIVEVRNEALLEAWQETVSTLADEYVTAETTLGAPFSEALCNDCLARAQREVEAIR